MGKYEEDPTKPCNRVVTNYCYNIVNNYQGYLTGIDILILHKKILVKSKMYLITTMLEL